MLQPSNPFIKSSLAPAQISSHPHINLSPNSDQIRPTSLQLRIIEYANMMCHDSPAPHSYHPTMGRRQRRQPIIIITIIIIIIIIIIITIVIIIIIVVSASV